MPGIEKASQGGGRSGWVGEGGLPGSAIFGVGHEAKNNLWYQEAG